MKTISQNSIKGSEFIVKELVPETIFTPEDFSEEQVLMKDSVKEFVDREIIAERSRFENKDYEYTKEVTKRKDEDFKRKTPEEYYGTCMSLLHHACKIYISCNGSFSTDWSIPASEQRQCFIWNKSKTKYTPKLASEIRMTRIV